MENRRLHPRISDAELVMLSWDENGTTLRQLGNVENLSSHGLAVIVDDPLPIGARVTITYGEGELTAVVRHFSPHADAYLMGLEFVGESKDSVLHFEPSLLVWPL